MTETPAVTVIVTVYKRLDYLREALCGVAAQTFGDYEVIVADDSGSGAAREIAATCVDASRLRYQANARTLGVAASLRRALDDARGRYISILNDDDVWEPGFLERLVVPLEENAHRVLAFCDHWIVNADGQIDHQATDDNTDAYGRRNLQAGDIANPHTLVLQNNAVPLAMGSLFRARAFDYRQIVPEVAGAYDFWISTLLAASGGGFFYVPGRLTRYRVHAHMETVRRSPDKSECFVFIWRSLYEGGKFRQLDGYIRSRLAESTVRAGRDRLYFNELLEARELFRQAFRTAPGWNPCASYLLSVLPLSIRKAAGVSRA